MDIEDLFPSKPGDPLKELARQDLDPMSVDELDERIAALEAEIARVKRIRPPPPSTAAPPKNCSKKADCRHRQVQ